MGKILKLFLLCTLLAFAALGSPPPAQALDRGDMGLVNPEIGVIEKSFPAINGQLAPNDNPPHPNGYALKAQYIPKNCQTKPPAAYCDTIRFQIDNGPHTELYFVRVTLSWNNPKTTAESSGVNMDMWMWPDEWYHHTQSDCCGLQTAQANTTTKHPEVMKIGEPAGTDDPATAKHNESVYWLTVVNYSGVNSGYKIKIEWALEDLGTFPTFTRPGGGRGIDSDPPTTGSKSGSRGIPSTTGAEAPEQTEIVKVPGPDGELIEVEVPVLGAQAARRPPERTSPLVWIIAAVIVLGLGTFAFLFLRKRRHAAESAY